MNEHQDANQRVRRRVVLGLAGLMGIMVTGCSSDGTNVPTIQGATSATSQAVITTPTPRVTPGTTLYVYQKHTLQVDDLAWSPDSQYIISASNGTFSQVGSGTPSQVYMWNARTGEPNATFTNEPEGITPLAWSPDGKMIAMSGQPASGDGSVNVGIYEAQTGKRIGGYDAINDYINQLTWSPDSSRLAIAGGHDVEICDASTGEKILAYPAALSPGMSQPSNVVAWSPDGNTIASAAAKDGHSLQFWDAHTGESLHYFIGSKPDVAVWSPDGKTLATGSTFTQSPQVLDSTTGQVLLTCQTKLPSFGQSSSMGYGIWRMPHTISWSPDSNYIAVANDQNQVQIWDVTKQNLTYTYTRHHEPVSAVAWSPDGSSIASASYDKTIHVWQAAPLHSQNGL